MLARNERKESARRRLRCDSLGMAEAKPPASFFVQDDEGAFIPTPLTRGPWDVSACHAGPPTGLLARALERVVASHRLTRLTVSLLRPIPMEGFQIKVDVQREGRTTALATAKLVGRSGKEAALAEGLFIARSSVGPCTTIEQNPPDFASAVAGAFPIHSVGHQEVCFINAVEIRFPPGEDGFPGPTTLWMKTPVLLPNELPSPFQAICPLADCGNAVGRNEEPTQMHFVNPDLTIVLHRDPEGEWFASTSKSHWGTDGIGLAEAELFDRKGSVGRAVQTLLLRRP